MPGKTEPALRAWSRGVKAPAVKIGGVPVEPGEFTCGYILVRWARIGRKPGNTIALVGPTGTGKSWCIALIKACLGGTDFYAPPKGESSYPLENLAWFLPAKRAIVLDEFSKRRMITFLGQKGWWKLFLDLQTDEHFTIPLPSNNSFDRRVFSEPAPFVYSSTVPIRLNVGDDGFLDYEEVLSENQQQTRRETQLICEVCVDRGLDERLPNCACCFSQYLWNSINHYDSAAYKKKKVPAPAEKTDFPSPAKSRKSM